MPEKIDYQSECLLYLRLKKSGEKVTQAEYCARRSKELGNDLSLAYFKKVLKGVRKKGGYPPPGKEKRAPRSHQPADAADAESVSDDRRDYGALRLEFLAGPWRTIAAFARDKGIKTSSNWFREKTRGWSREKRDMSHKVNEAAAKTLVEERAAQKVKGVYGLVQQLEWKLLRAAEKLTDGVEKWKPAKSAAAAYYGALFIKEMHAALKDMAPFVQGMDRIGEVNRVFDSLGKGDMNIHEGTLELLKLGVEIPRVFQILLSQGPPDEPPADEKDIISQEKILARRSEILKQIEQQRIEWLPARLKEVADLKAEMGGRDSFAEQKLVIEGRMENE